MLAPPVGRDIVDKFPPIPSPITTPSLIYWNPATKSYVDIGLGNGFSVYDNDLQYTDTSGPYVPIAGNYGEPMTGPLYFDADSYTQANGYGVLTDYANSFLTQMPLGSGTGYAFVSGGFYSLALLGAEITSGIGNVFMGDYYDDHENTFINANDNNQAISANAAGETQWTSANVYFTLEPNSYNTFQVNTEYYPNGFLNIHASGAGYGSLGDEDNAINGTVIYVNDQTRQAVINADFGMYFTGSAIGFTGGLYNMNTGVYPIDSSGDFYHYNGNPFSVSGNLYYSTGQILSNGNDLNFYGQFTQNGNIYVDTSGFLHTPLGLKDNSGSAGAVHAPLTSTGSGTKWGYSGSATLSSGTKAVTVTGVTSSNIAVPTLTTPGGTLGNGYKSVCTTNTVTITSVTAAGVTQTLDTSTLNFVVF